MKKDGFIIGFRGMQGYLELEHPDLIIEFLVPEIGRGTRKPYKLDNLSINAQALRYLTFLSENTITLKVNNFSVTLPHPVNFALHKLIILQRRTNKEKAAKDLHSAINLLKILIRNKEIAMLQAVYKKLPSKWKSSILKSLREADEADLLNLFNA